MAERRIGVLLMAYGTPDGPDDIGPYYTHVRGGRPPTPAQLVELQERYQAIGGRSPLAAITRAQAGAVAAELNATAPAGVTFTAYVGMKHWHPFIEDTVAAMGAAGLDGAVALAMAPQYSRLSVAGYLKAVAKGLDRLQEPLSLLAVQSYHDHPIFLDALAHKVRTALRRFADPAAVTTVFTAHSLPAKIVDRDDPYPRHLQETAAGVARLLDLTDWTLAYQSAGHSDVPWLGPDISEVLPELAAAGRRGVLVCPAGFVADHLEVLYDIDVACRQQAAALGLQLERTEMLNTDRRFITALAAVVRAQIARDEPAWLHPM